MAGKNTGAAAPETDKQKVRKTAEGWALEKKVPGVYLAGVKCSNRWSKGKMLSEEEFDAAVREFLDSAADGRKK